MTPPFVKNTICKMYPQKRLGGRAMTTLDLLSDDLIESEAEHRLGFFDWIFRVHASLHMAYEDAPKPALRSGDALVRVIATSITKTELTWDETYRDCNGRPRIPTIPGHEFAGLVDALAPEAAGVRLGDAVYALSSFCRDGSAAEFIAIRAADLAPKPHSLNFEQAAAVPLAGLTAWQALFDHAQIEKGERVLIHGAAGGVGTYAVQLANWKGAEVIATASAKDHNFLSELGASEVIDYAHEHFEEKVEDVDVVLDTVGGETQQRSWGVLRRGGILISIVSPVA